MADLTLERIAELRGRGWPFDVDDTELMLDILDAAERGLTAMAWTVNGPDVEKPEGRCVIRLTQEVTSGSPYRAADWAKCYWKMADGWPASDEFVTHFMANKEPTDA